MFNRLLKKEIMYIYPAIWHSYPSEKTIQRYIAAHEKYMFVPDSDEQRMMEIIIDNRLDIESIEVYLRRRDKENIITKKIAIMSYIAESLSENYELYYSHGKSGSSVYPGLASVLTHSIVCHLRGWLLNRRFNFVR